MGKIAFMYPGQGTQKIGMGKSFYEGSERSKAIFDMADEILGFPVTEICFKENDLLNRTEYTQPALFTCCLAMTEEIMNRGIMADVTLGLSLGEYAAIATAGGFSKELALKTVQARGACMSQVSSLCKTVMYVVLGLETDQIEKIIENMKDVYIANYNCPGQIVLTGKKAAVEKAIQLLKEAGAKKCILTKLTVPFHSPLLKKAGEQFANYLENVQIEDLRIPYVSNVTANYIKDKTQVKELLVRHITSPIYFEKSVRCLIEDGVDIFIEIGPGKILSTLVKKIDDSVTVVPIETMEDLENISLERHNNTTVICIKSAKTS